MIPGWSMAQKMISLREFARRRGVSLGAVQKAIKSGRVTAIERDQHGRTIGIDEAQASEQWAMNTDLVEAARNGKLPMQADRHVTQHYLDTPPPRSAAVPDGSASDESQGSGAQHQVEQPAAESAAAASAPASSDQAEYLAARARREQFQAETAKLDHLERLGLLVSSVAVEQEIGEIFSEVRSNTFRIADKLSQSLAAEPDPLRVHRLLSNEFRTVFDELSHRFAADTSGGVEEPSPAMP